MRIALLAFSICVLQIAAPAETEDSAIQALLVEYRYEPDNSLLCEQIGVAYTRLNAMDKAAEFFRKAVALSPERIPAKKNLATVLWFLGRKDESASLFSSLESRVPNDPVPKLYLGLSAYDRKNIEVAAAHFERAGSLASDNPDTFATVVDTYLIAGRVAQARQMLERRTNSGAADAKTYRLLGDAYDKLALPEKAEQAYSAAIEKAPQDEEYYLALAGFAIAHANTGFARQVLARGLQAVLHSSKLTLERGLSWGIEGDFEAAKESFAEANAADPKWSMPLLALGVTDLQTGNPDAAADCFRKAKSIAPEDYRCYYLHALALTRSHTSQEPAIRTTVISELRRAIVLAPEQTQARIALAKAEMAGGHQALAERQLREAIRITPSEPGALYNLALLCRREGKTEEAARLIQTFQRVKTKSQDEENQFVLILRTVN
jgi:tetratricopeptide (TPR) repeat protein